MSRKFTDEQIDFMRVDMETNFGYSQLIEATRKRFEKEGRNFDKEFKEWEKENK
jgi:hypothetical protein